MNYSPQKEIDIETLRMAVTGKSKDLSRTLALTLLQSHDYPNKSKDLQTVLENNNEPTTLRYLAAVYLGRTNIPDVQDILIKNVRIDDERVLAGVVEALGRVGDSRAIPALLDTKNSKKGSVSSKANFAVALISHRFGLQGNELPIPTEQEYLKMSKDTKPVKISHASREEINKCINCISDRQFGIQLSQEQAHQVIIGKDIHLVFLNKQYADIENVKQLLQRKSILGIIVYKSEEHESYSVEYLILSSPTTQSGGNIDVIIASPNGDIMFGGMLNIRDDNIKFSLRSTSQPGGFPLIIEGNLINKKLKLSCAEFSPSIRITKQPEKVSQLYKV